tara:strand:- start:516 stop:668 length:153 start_codon:yes stop_codon:yes gene_type:complete
MSVEEIFSIIGKKSPAFALKQDFLLSQDRTTKKPRRGGRGFLLFGCPRLA